MGFGFRYTTDWEYVTSEDTTYQVLAAYSRGKIQLRNTVDGSTMDIQYNCLSASFGKGYALTIAESDLTDPSGGVGPVMSDRVFDSFCFPCRGYILNFGGTVGFLRGQWKPGTGGGSLNVYLFGQVPVFAGVRSWGKFRSTTPGVGFGGGLAHFWI
jgi:hypothetical protein